ncbi:oligosaccharide flippase family protein [bacterium]|nr:oligosaccharide flippase family protein [bacterium]
MALASLKIDALRYAILAAAFQLLGLLRVVVVADILGAELQGLGLMIGVVTAFFLASFQNGTDVLSMQRPFQAREGFLETAYSIGFGRAILVSLGILLAAPLAAKFFGEEVILLPIAALAIIPVLRSFQNASPWMDLSEGDYRAVARMEFITATVGFAAAMIAIALFQNVWVYVVMGVSTPLCAAVGSHLYCRRKYRLALRREYFGEILRFTIPLMPAGLAFFVASQAESGLLAFASKDFERFGISLALLGAYGTVATLLLTPQGPLGRLMQSLILGRIQKENQADFDEQRIAGVALSGLRMTGVLIAAYILASGVPFRFVGGMVLTESYQPGLEICFPIGFVFMMKMLRSAAYNCALGNGSTTVTMHGNLLRAILILIPASALFIVGGLIPFVWSMVLAEVVTLAFVSSILLKRKYVGLREFGVLFLLPMAAAALSGKLFMV